MELDLLAAAETESDSESNHSNQDNASGRRSVVTAATAGSEAGMSYFIRLSLIVQSNVVNLALFLRRCKQRASFLLRR